MPHENHERVAGPRSGEKATEVGVGGDQDTLLHAGVPKNVFVRSCLHADIAYVDPVVLGRLRRFG
jgi:hypothetical protein